MPTSWGPSWPSWRRWSRSSARPRSSRRSWRRAPAWTSACELGVRSQSYEDAPAPAGPKTGSAAGNADGSAQPLGRLADPLAHVDPRAPPEQPLGLLDARPAPDDVDLERRLVFERERVGVAARLLPDDPSDLGDGELLGGADVEVLVHRRRRGHGGDDAVGDVVDVGERPRVRAVAEDRQRRAGREAQALADQVRHRVGDARLVLGHLARAVGVERAADRVVQAVLVVRGADVELAR